MIRYIIAVLVMTTIACGRLSDKRQDSLILDNAYYIESINNRLDSLISSYKLNDKTILKESEIFSESTIVPSDSLKEFKDYYLVIGSFNKYSNAIYLKELNKGSSIKLIKTYYRVIIFNSKDSSEVINVKKENSDKYSDLLVIYDWHRQL